MSKDQLDPDAETAAARRLTDALGPSAIDALLADAKVAGTPIDGVDGLLNQMTLACGRVIGCAATEPNNAT